jgi:type I restriction enzyme S subunit
MASDGTIATVGDAFDLVNGFAFKSADFIESGIPVIKIKNVKAGEFSEQNFSYVGEKFLEKRGDTLARVGDLLISMSGNRHDGSPHTWVGKVARFNRRGRYFINQRVGALRPKPNVEVDLKYAGYVLASMSYQEHFIAVATSSGGQANLSPSQILGAPLSLPSYAEQYGIGHLISLLDDRIDLLRQTNTTLEAIAQTLFKSWFVDFDPVHAKAEDREPEAMDAVIAALFPGEFEVSELGLIPKGWRLTKVGEVAELVKGCSYKGAGLSETDGAYMFNLGCFNAKRIFATEKIKRYTGPYRERHVVVEGDLIVANTDMTPHREILGRPLFVPAECEPGFVSHHVFKVSPALPNKAQWKQFLFFAFQQPAFRERAVGYATGTTVLALARDSAEKCPIVDPGKALLIAFSELVTPLLSQIANNLQREKCLEQVRDTLLPRLISGKLRLPDVEREIEAVV